MSRTPIPTLRSAQSNDNSHSELWDSTGTTVGDSAVDQSDDNQDVLPDKDLTDDEPSLKRKSPFCRFTNGSQEDIELLSAIEQFAPYEAHYGRRKEAWESVFTHLKNLDDDRPTTPRYTILSEKACKKRWEVHQALVRQYEISLKTATGIVPPPSAHLERMRRVVAAANACKERADSLKSRRAKKREVFQQRHSAVEEMRELATQRNGKRPIAALEQSDTRESSGQGQSARSSSTRDPGPSSTAPSSSSASASASSRASASASASSRASASASASSRASASASASSSSRSNPSTLPTMATSKARSRSSMSRDGSSSPASSASADATANTETDGTANASSSSPLRTPFDLEIQKLQLDYDAIARYLEAESDSRRRMEDTLQKLLTVIESGQGKMEDTLQKLTTVIESGQQVNLQILQALQDLKSGK